MTAESSDKVDRAATLSTLVEQTNLTDNKNAKTFDFMSPASDLSAIEAVPPFNETVTRDIIRQVEYYFSDQNLPNDPHLLGLAGGDGNGDVSFNEICGFRKMRDYKPRSSVKLALDHSAVLDVIKQGKKYRIKRRFPLKVKLNVRPEVNIEQQHINATLAANPHLTKAMLKPTGFEEYYAEAPMTPAQYEKDQQRYDPNNSFEERIETAIRHYSLRRKMHQSNAKIFSMWMNFGGINTAPNAFQGGLDDEDLEDLDKEEIAALKCRYSVDDFITSGDNVVVVNFVEVALAFLSLEFPTFFNYDNPAEVDNVCNVMVNFFNYLLHHDVCPEYVQQILNARKAVQAAAPELKKLPFADEALRGIRTFNDACTQIHKDQDNEDDSPWAESYRVPISAEKAMEISKVGLLSHATDEQVKIILERFDAMEEDGSDTESVKTIVPEDVHKSPSPFKVVVSETLSMEIVALVKPEGKVAAYFKALEGTGMPRLGLMRCQRWENPGAPPEDLPAIRPQIPETFDLIVEDTILNACYPGLKIQAQIKQLDTGFCWLQRYDRAFPSFFTFIQEVKQVKKRAAQNREAEAFLAARAALRAPAASAIESQAENVGGVVAAEGQAIAVA